jgi:HEAT repeat protein
MVMTWASLMGGETEQVRRIHAHLWIGDAAAAAREAAVAVQEAPDSPDLRRAYIYALSEAGAEVAVLEEWEKLSAHSAEAARERYLLEALAWGVLKKAGGSDQIGIRFNSLIGAAFTGDVRALAPLINAMRGTNCLLRALAVKLTAYYGDTLLQEELLRMLREEKVWYVRLEVIDAIGNLRIFRAQKTLCEIVCSSRTSVEEKAEAMVALTKMVEEGSREEIEALVRSARAGLRELACELIASLDLKEYVPELLSLLTDSSPDVRMEALHVLGQFRSPIARETLLPLLSDSSPKVAITAAWVALLSGLSEGEAALEKWIGGEYPEGRRMASAAVRYAGGCGTTLAARQLRKSRDPFVRANLAMGLIGSRCFLPLASDALSELLNEKELWMWERKTPFSSLAPSQLHHVDQVPSYPEMIDSLVRLEVLNMLSIIRAPQAQEKVKNFLQTRHQGVAGNAASILMTEGDEEAFTLVRDLLKDPDPQVQMEAALVLALFNADPASLKVLEAAYPQASREMKIYILEAMGRVGDPRSIPFLVGVFKEPFQVLRVVAASSVIQCLNHG